MQTMLIFQKKLLIFETGNWNMHLVATEKMLNLLAVTVVKVLSVKVLVSNYI